jgi:hypothetical protein
MMWQIRVREDAAENQGVGTAFVLEVLNNEEQRQATIVLRLPEIIPRADAALRPELRALAEALQNAPISWPGEAG